MKSVIVLKKIHQYLQNNTNEKALIQAVLKGNSNPNDIPFLKAMKLLLLAKRVQWGVPFAYVVGSVPFLETTILVHRGVLIPRVETELLAEKVVQQLKDEETASVLDLCTGSGAIAVAVAKNTRAKVWGCDISNRALSLAKKNAWYNQVEVQFFKSDLFLAVQGRFDVIVSNPPYIPTVEIQKLDASVRKYEPHVALNGGVDGLQFYRNIAMRAPQHLNKNGTLWLEIGHDQAKAVKELLQQNFEKIEIYKDYSGFDRMIKATKKESSSC